VNCEVQTEPTLNVSLDVTARLYEPARGIDEHLVVPDRPMQSISVEDTFQEDVLLAETEPMIRHLAEKLWPALH
jgi:DNA polymerase IV